MKFFGRAVFSLLCGVAAGFIAKGFGLEGNVPFFIGFGVACVVQLAQG